MNSKELIIEAIAAREKAYCPYSGFAVGAALLTKSGKVYTGCNIENSSFSPTVCAERVALFKAVSVSETEFDSIAVVGGSAGESLTHCTPCGVCRQVMSEFNDGELRVILATSPDEYEIFTLAQLLPEAFRKT